MPNLPDPYEKCSPEFLNPHAIKRIALKDSAMVDVLRVESPSSLFVRPIDHIRDQLVYREPYPLTPMAKYDAGNYALAPIEERVFGRCIIVRNIELLEACRVFFIDEAITANVSWKCLFEIDEEQRFHPWQVMHVTLGRMVSLTVRRRENCIFGGKKQLKFEQKSAKNQFLGEKMGEIVKKSSKIGLI